MKSARTGWLAVLCLCAATAAPSVSYAQAQPLALQPGDRILFIGDEITQQMFYIRAVGAALLALHPEKNLRIFNGGKASATAADALTWIDELMGLVQPNVVFIGFGFNEAQNNSDPAETMPAYLKTMSALMERISLYTTVREQIVIGPPPLQKGLRPQLMRGELNHTLLVLSRLSQQVAASRQARYVNLYDHLSAVYLAQAQVGGESLSIGGRLPNEQAHMVIASVVLRDIGVTGPQLTRIGWSPLLPAKMRRVRQVLAMPLPAPEAQAAQRSHEVYVEIGRFDEHFFRIWRLPRRRARNERQLAEAAWGRVRQRLAANGAIVR